MIHGQTACLLAVAQVVAEGHSRDYHKCRNLTKERNQIDKDDENEKYSNTNLLQKIWNFYRSKRMINKEFSNKNQLIWILNAKVMDKSIQFGQDKSQLN